MATLDNWPLPSYRGRNPVISSSWGMRGKGTKRKMHSGADIDYRAVEGDPPYTGKYTADRSPHFYGPPNVPVIAAASGVVTRSVTQDKSRGVVEITHPPTSPGAPKVISIYRHLSSRFVRKGQPVESGTRLGIMGGSRDHPFRHVHFAVRIGGKLVDPGPMLKRSTVMVLTLNETLSPAVKKPKPAKSPGEPVARKPGKKGATGWLILLALLAVVKSRSR